MTPLSPEKYERVFDLALVCSSKGGLDRSEVCFLEVKKIGGPGQFTFAHFQNNQAVTMKTEHIA